MRRWLPIALVTLLAPTLSWSQLPVPCGFRTAPSYCLSPRPVPPTDVPEKPSPVDHAVSKKLAPKLQRAQKAIDRMDYDRALAELKAADAVPGKTAYDQYMIDLLRTLATLRRQP